MTPFQLSFKTFQQGLSLVELMVSLTLGMMIVTTIGYIYVGATRTFRTLETVSRMQENARYAIERIGYDLRMAGFSGCYQNQTTTFTSALNNPNSWQFNLQQFPLLGYEGGVSAFPNGIDNRSANADGLTIVRADNAQDYIVNTHQANSATIHLIAPHDIEEGDIVIMTDCKHSAIFQMTNRNNGGNGNVPVVHNTGASSPGNFTRGLGIPNGAASPHYPAANCAADATLTYCKGSLRASGADYTFAQGSRIYRMNAVTYYIGFANGNQRDPRLYTERLAEQGGQAVTEAEEVVEGVEDMQISYGVDTSPTPDRTVDIYTTADQVASVSPAATLEEDWRRVLSVRISLLMVTRNGENATDSPQTYTFNGRKTVAPDNRLRKVFNATIAIRNRL